MDGLGVSEQGANAPARHVVGFGEGVELDGDLFGARRLEQAGGDVAIEGHLSVGGVVAEEQVEE